MQQIFIKVNDKHNIVDAVNVPENIAYDADGYIQAKNIPEDFLNNEPWEYTYQNGTWGKVDLSSFKIPVWNAEQKKWEERVLAPQGQIEEQERINNAEWVLNDNLFGRWQKAEKLGWTAAQNRKKSFDEHTKKVTSDWRAVQKLKKELGEK